MEQPTDNCMKAGKDFKLQTSDFILQTSDFRLQNFFSFLIVGSRKSEVCCLKSLLGFRTIKTRFFFFQYTYATLPIRLAILLYEYKRMIPL